MRLSGRSQYAKQIEKCFDMIALKYSALVARKQKRGVPLLPQSGGLGEVHEFYGFQSDGEDGVGKKVVPHLQGAISKYHYGVMEEKLKDGEAPPTIARIQACKARNASAWLRPPPVSVNPLSDKAFRMSHRSDSAYQWWIR